jgi:membrane protein DedA with SNARE-associated domain
MTLESFKEAVETYGYLAVLIGTLMEGDVALLLGGLCTRCTELKLYGVILAAFTGALMGDQFFFYLGRFKGVQVLNRFPRLKVRAERVFTHLHRHGFLVSFAFRFVYGFRILAPLLLGASRMGRTRFTLLNCLGALFWAVLVACLGSLMGEALILLLKQLETEIRHWLPAILGGLLLLGGIIRLIVWYVRRRRAQRILDAGPLKLTNELQ